MHARWRVPEPGRDLAGREPVNEVRAHRLVATLRRFGRLKEIRRSDPHTSTDLPELHPYSVERLSDSMARPTSLTTSASPESLRVSALHRSSPSARDLKQLVAEEPIVQIVPLRSWSAMIAKPPKQRLKPRRARPDTAASTPPEDRGLCEVG